MKKAVAIVLLAMSFAAHAHWEFSRFGMNRDQLGAAGQRAGSEVADGFSSGGSWGSLRARNMRLFGERADVDFSFDFMDRLEEVVVEPKGGCDRIRRQLVNALGEPDEKNKPYIGMDVTEETWFDDGRGNTVTFQQGKDCFVTYTQSEEDLIAGLTRDAAQDYLAQLTKRGWVRMYLDGGKKEYEFDHTGTFANKCGTFFITKTPFQANVDWSKVGGIWSKGDTVSVDTGRDAAGVLEYSVIGDSVATHTVSVMRFLARNCSKQ